MARAWPKHFATPRCTKPFMRASAPARPGLSDLPIQITVCSSFNVRSSTKTCHQVPSHEWNVTKRPSANPKHVTAARCAILCRPKPGQIPVPCGENYNSWPEGRVSAAVLDAGLAAVALATASVFTISVSCEIWPCWARNLLILGLQHLPEKIDSVDWLLNWSRLKRRLTKLRLLRKLLLW